MKRECEMTNSMISRRALLLGMASAAVASKAPGFSMVQPLEVAVENVPTTMGATPGLYSFDASRLSFRVFDGSKWVVLGPPLDIKHAEVVVERITDAAGS